MNYIARNLEKIKKIGIKGIYNRLAYKIITREVHKSFGPKNSELTFYIIRGIDHHEKHYQGVAMNLLANYSYVLSHMMYAKKHGWLPIIDQIHDPVNNKESYSINGTYNPWEYYWQQPIPYNLHDVYLSKHVILSKRSWYLKGDLGYSPSKHLNKELIQEYHNLAKEIPLKHDIKEKVQEQYEKIFVNGKKILGVNMRRGGYGKEDEYHAPNHPIQLAPSEMIDIVKTKISRWDIDLIFLATEEQKYIDLFSEEFGNLLIYMPRERYNGWKKYTESANPLYQPGKRYQTALDYLIEMELLSRCNCLIGSITSGLRYAIIQNNLQFEKIEIIDNGYWN